MIWDVSRFVSLDLETHLIGIGNLAPKIVCGAFALPLDDREDPIESKLLLRQPTLEWSRKFLDSDKIIVGANIAFDFGCLVAADPSLLPLIFRAYSENRVYDVQIAQALHAIACGNLFQDPTTGKPLKGRYSLERCVEYVLGRINAKDNDEWRWRYAELDGIPLKEWPAEARQYPIDDVVNTLEVAVAQVQGDGGGVTPGPHRNLGDLSKQAETSWAMHLGAIWGIRTDPSRVAALEERVEKAHAEFVEKFRSLGLLTSEGKKNLKAIRQAVIRAYGESGPCSQCTGGKVFSPKTGNAINCTACSGTGMNTDLAPRTATGGVSTDRDALLESGDPDLVAFGDNEPEKIRETYLPKLKTEELGRKLSPNVLLASGRASYAGLIQLMPKEGGVRECHRARPGYVLCSVDYSAIELCTLAQIQLIWFGHSVMADTINATGDPGALHTAFGARLLGISTPEMMTMLKSSDLNIKSKAKKTRDASKAGNFGFMGGMGGAKFVFAKRKKSEGRTIAPDGTVYPGIRFCLLLGGKERCGTSKITSWKGRPTPAAVCEECTKIADDQLRPAWFQQWPEMKPYLKVVSDRVGNEGWGELPCIGTERVRGGLDFTQAANHSPQALASDGVKHANRMLSRECYLDRKSVLYGSRPIFTAHDEIIAEIPESVAHLAAPRMADVMISAMREYTPGITIRAEPALMRYWTKAAEPIYRDGRLIPWEDRDIP